MSDYKRIHRRSGKDTFGHSSTPAPNPFKTRGFGQGLQARSAELPTTDILQKRGTKPPTKPQETPDLDVQLKQAKQFGYNAINIPVFAPAPTSATIQRLRYKKDGANVDINTLSFARVLDYLKRADPDPDPGGVFFDAGDKAALQQKADSLYLAEFNILHTFLGSPEIAIEKTARNIPASVDLQQILMDMRARYQAGNLPGFQEWLASVNVNLNTLNVLDKINELRAAQNIGGVANVDETPIPGTNQTADITHGTAQTEVKTIRQPIQSYADFTGQVTAALAKFANVNPGDGNTYNATIYGSINQDLIAGRTAKKKGIITNLSIDPASLDKVTTINRESDGQQLNQQIENQLDKLLDNLNTQNWPGANRTHHIYIVLENGTQQHLVRNVATNQWARF